MNTDTHAHHGPGYKLFVIIWCCLLVLTAVTVYAAEIDLGFLNVALAMTIASTKAALVTFFFMHLKYENLTFKLMVLICFIILAIFIGLTFFDTVYRPLG
ncbi:Cytochrome c oxidase subunit IV [Pseudodesulfovibrio profundus]|uniref:Cytochrome c oxidase subunit IV n=1 Tax=Pseudodesulfovibrio profundus TaxID=57320 RepID=A0A2C8F960_9BACT|nr:cytochrome C oxidase subunit IV family protein [Pseudodesulfovibrio profundus]MBC16079.1 cytochrome-c oxidase [Desulfovibrio sp.]SOB59305.1 Cytochrome c oxidase subunit IV [Pseudodesulfovibrio profundus]|tara:strand:+ start:827 stop:1126 length:300 start_codon:yes stop_codon:yes gene_type:complete